ncbi:hypothetical protein JW898_03175 [Candidatus Woesearchaeota archaeon]|nr:hypothetical protein [Candidatus Woesearchaeota archaeon]
MNGLNENGINYEDRLRGIKVLSCLQRADFAKRKDGVYDKVTEEENNIIRVALGVDSGIPQRIDAYIQAFEMLKGQGTDLKGYNDGSFLVQASRLYALIDDAFGRLAAFVPDKDTEPARQEYKKFFARLYGPWYGLPVREQAEAAIDLGDAGKLLKPCEIKAFNHYGPSVRASSAPVGVDVEPASWPGNKLEVKAGMMLDTRGIEDFVSSRSVLALDAEDTRTVSAYLKSMGFMRNVTAERGFLNLAIQAVFGYDDSAARRFVGEMMDRNKYAGRDTEKALAALAKDEDCKIREIENQHLAERAPKITTILLALNNLPEDRRKYATYVALDAVRNFTRGLSDQCIRILSTRYETLATHPAMLRSRDALLSRK